MDVGIICYPNKQKQRVMYIEIIMVGGGVQGDGG